MTKTSWQTGNLKMNEDLGNPSSTCFVSRVEDWRKAKTSEAKTNSIVFDIAENGRNSVLCYNFAHEFVLMKRSQESSSLNSL